MEESESGNGSGSSSPSLTYLFFHIQELSQQLENGIGGRKVSGCPIREFVNNEGKRFSGMHNSRTTDILRGNFFT
jgi:hypothetical protein